MTPPARLDRVAERLALTPGELAVLTKNGFVVPERLAFDSFTVALHELYQSELPLWLSVDAILHSVFVSHDDLVLRLELTRAIPALNRALSKMHRALAGRPYPKEVKDDLEVYLTVARTLLAGHAPNTNAEAAALADQAKRANALATVSLFGRDRVIDFSQYAPRGHYAKSEPLARFFRAAMWTSRLELNLVSRSSRSSQPGVVPNPEETPREAVDALALGDLAEASGALGDVEALDRGWGALAGAREDVPLGKLAEIARREGTLTIPGSFDALKKAIGADFARTTRLHYMPEGSTELPVIATMLGPRVVPDAAATRPLVHGGLPDRYDIGAPDIAYMLGHDRAKRYLEGDIAKFPGLPAALERARTIAMKPSAGVDVYGAWFDVVRALSSLPAPERAGAPSFVMTEAFRDLRIDETVAAYAQLKHDYVLLAGQPYDEGACAVPDAFVDPALGAWNGLVAYATRARAAFHELDPKDSTQAQAYFARLGTIARVLRAIAADELAGRAVSADELAFLSSVVEIHSEDIGSGFDTRYDGWYFDLFLSRPSATTSPPPGHPEEPSMKYAGFIADFYTSVNSGRVAYAGATFPRLGVFVVDTGGPPRVVVGPVAHAFQHRAPLEKRLKDADVPTLSGTEAPWAASYEVPAPAEPPLVVDVELEGGEEPAKGHSARLEVMLRSARALGAVEVVALDHHRRPVATLSKDVSTKTVRYLFPSRVQRFAQGTHGTEMLAIKVGEWTGFVDLFVHAVPVGFGGMKPPRRD